MLDIEYCQFANLVGKISVLSTYLQQDDLGCFLMSRNGDYVLLSASKDQIANLIQSGKIRRITIHYDIFKLWERTADVWENVAELEKQVQVLTDRNDKLIAATRDKKSDTAALAAYYAGIQGLSL